MRVGAEYRLQTTEGAEWDRAFRERRQALTEVEIANRRDQLFAQAVQAVLGEIRPVQGEARLRRKLALHAGADPPTASGEAVSVWLRDGWSCGRRHVDAEARRPGADDPTPHYPLTSASRPAPGGIALSWTRSTSPASNSMVHCLSWYVAVPPRAPIV